jgi:23S rRNA (adenine2503-C2)-methyltransferase
MPINNRYSISELMNACKYYYSKTGRRISFEYTLIHNQNDFDRDAEELSALLKSSFSGTDAPLHVNLIRVNEVKERDFMAGSTESAHKFAKKLESLGVVATVRRRLGRDINGACGQLRRSKITVEEDNA